MEESHTLLDLNNVDWNTTIFILFYGIGSGGWKGLLERRHLVLTSRTCQSKYLPSGRCGLPITQSPKSTHTHRAHHTGRAKWPV